MFSLPTLTSASGLSSGLSCIMYEVRFRYILLLIHGHSNTGNYIINNIHSINSTCKVHYVTGDVHYVMVTYIMLLVTYIMLLVTYIMLLVTYIMLLVTYIMLW